MTRNRSWLALGALLVALAGGALWAADQKKADKAPAPPCCAEEKGCTKAQACPQQAAPVSAAVGCAHGKACCEEKCCAEEKAKGCCADGKCCDCCTKKPQMATLPVPPGSAIQVMIAPPGAFGEEGCADWVGPLAPPPAPVCQPAPPMPFAPPVNQYYSAPCLAPPPPPVAVSPWGGGRPTPWRVSVVQEGGKSCLGMQVGVSKDTAAVCEGMTLKVGGDLKLCVVGKQVQVSGKCIKATADSVCWSAESGEILLDGSVKLKYECDAHKAEIAAQQVVVGVPDGRIEVMGAGHLGMPQTCPVSTGCPATTSPTRCPSCPGPGEAQQVFNFFTGFFR